MSAIRHEDAVTGRAKLQLTRQAGPRCQLFDGDAGRNLAKRIDLDGQRKGAQRLHNLALVGDDDHACGCRRDDLLAQQCTAAALDEPQRVVNLIRTVNGQIQFRQFIERFQRHAKLDAQTRGALGCRHALDLEAGGDLLGQKPDEFLGRRTRADTEPHPILYMGQCGLGGLDFHLAGIHVPETPVALSSPCCLHGSKAKRKPFSRQRTERCDAVAKTGGFA